MSPTTVPGFSDLTEIGRGGFGVVYRAPQAGFGRDVAIKVLTNSRPDAAERRSFEKETATAGKLSGHPHIATLYQAGFTEDERPYLVMALHEKGSLRSRLEADGPLPWPEVAMIGINLAGALATAHAAKIIHRDVKPDNVLIDDFGTPVLTDFGIASVVEGEGATLTSTGDLAMTVAYTPPEVLDGARPDQRTDVFALGATLFALLAGHPPFARPGDTSVAQVIARMLREDAPDLAQRGVPGPLAIAIGRALARDHDQRTPSAVRLGEDLQAAQRALGEAVTSMVLPEGLEEGAEADRTLALPDLDWDALGASDSGPPGAPVGHDPTAPLHDRGAAPPHAPTAPRSPGPPVAQRPGSAPGGPGAHGQQAPKRGRRLGPALMGALLGLVVLALAGGAWVLFSSTDQPRGGPTAPPTDVASATVAAPATSGESTIPPAPQRPPSAEPTPGPSDPTTAPPPGPTPDTPQVAVLASHPAADGVAATFQRWADGINTAQYAAAFDAYTAALQGRVGFNRFTEGNATSTILAPALVSVDGDGAEVVAVIEFRSLQDPSLGPNGQDCSDWRLAWTLVQRSGSAWLVDDSDAIDGTPRAC